MSFQYDHFPVMTNATNLMFALAYESMFKDAHVVSGLVEPLRKQMLNNFPRYEIVALRCHVPPVLVAILHYLECGFRFDRHLHNGDYLYDAQTQQPIPTVGVPAGRGPFNTWEDSAVDAILGHNESCAVYNIMHPPIAWNLSRMLYFFETYNGMGYRTIELPSPYLWAGSQHYTKGKFVADGQYDQEMVSKQVGAAVILKQLIQHYELTINPPAELPMFAIATNYKFAVPSLQLALNSFMPWMPRLVHDGIVGPKTLARIQKVANILDDAKT